MANSEGVELNENVPLKNTQKKSCFQYFFEGSRFITTSFGVFSIVLTIALLVQIYYGDFQVVPHGSVATDSRECSTIGTQILKQGGNAIDSTIASAFCLAVVNPHTCGLDAGGYLMIYNHKTREDAQVIDFTDQNNFPRLLIGMIKAHKLYGKLPWKELIQPAADIAMKGSFVSTQLQLSIKKAKVQKLFPLIQAGSKYKQEALANFLKTIADIPDLYNQIKIDKKLKSKKGQFKNYNVYVPEKSDKSISDIFITTLKELEKINSTNEIIDYTYILANLSMKSYKDFKINDNFKEGTSTNIAVMDKNDLYVSLVMGLSEPFGSKNLTEMGYIKDTIGEVPNTFLPIILINKDFICAKRFVLGVGNLATALQLVTGLIINDNNSTFIIEKPRFIILPNKFIGYEEDHTPTFNQVIKDNLSQLGQPTYLQEPYVGCNIIEKISDELNSHSDSRGGGFASRF